MEDDQENSMSAHVGRSPKPEPFPMHQPAEIQIKKRVMMWIIDRAMVDDYK